MRIASLLPSATEIAFANGAGSEVVGVSHECDYPSETQGLPVLTAAAVFTRGLPQAEIDVAISGLLASGGLTYTIDVPTLRSLRPDLVVTQSLCDVCAVSAGQVHRVMHEAELGAGVLTLTPLDLGAVVRSVAEVGEAMGHTEAGGRFAAELRARLSGFGARPARRPRVVALEWLDPPYAAGHWVPEQIEIAGGMDVLGRAGERSQRVTLGGDRRGGAQDRAAPALRPRPRGGSARIRCACRNARVALPSGGRERRRLGAGRDRQVWPARPPLDRGYRGANGDLRGACRQRASPVHYACRGRSHGSRGLHAISSTIG